MHSSIETSTPITSDLSALQSHAVNHAPVSQATSYSDYRIIRRNGAVVGFEPSKIAIAVTKAFLAVNGGQGAASARIRELVEQLTASVVSALVRRQPTGGTFHIEDIQDQVELALMRSGEHDVARAYVLYRAKRQDERRQQLESQQASKTDIAVPQIHVIVDGQPTVLDIAQVRNLITAACVGLDKLADPEAILAETLKNLYDGVPVEELHKSAILAARALMEKEPAYSQVTARLLLHTVRKEVFGKEVAQQAAAAEYVDYFPKFIKKGIEAELLDAKLGQFDLKKLANALVADRDLQFGYIGLQTLYDRYFLHVRGTRIEMPQAFYMRVAMGLAISEIDREARAIEFYNLLSSFDFMSSTPTLFNSGTQRSQLSSCYLTTVADDLDGIYEAIKENALLAKYAGGLGNDWTPVRSLGAHIKGTNGKSQGVVPFLKVVNDTAVAVNQGGKRKGAVCAYLETWHMDIEEFLDLRKNTGDDRRRTHDMNTANWIPDLFMKRVMEKGDWTLFSPSDVPDLHEKFGKAFEQAYVAYEAKAASGELELSKKIPALDLWRKMLSMLFETGHPWITFKDPCNIRSPQQHAGVVHSSNLCTEITLNTNDSEIAVCNLGSVNMPAHMKDGKLDHIKLQKTIRTAMRMLDNVIDINYYAVKKARDSNLRHRPVGLGIMGFQDCLHMMRIPYASMDAVQFADNSMEAVCYYAYLASSELAEERGAYSSYRGSLWDRGILPQDSLKLLAEERGGYLEVDYSETMDWSVIRNRIKQFGMRNSNCVAIAPTATISNIIGVSACIEPTYQNLYVKSNLSGEFTEINESLVRDLKARGLWDEVMIADLKYFDGSLAKIDRIPQDLRELYATAFEVSPSWLVEAASRRQKWIDQAQSLNIYMSGASGKKLDETYKLAWLRGLKTTYYLRTIGATHTEKSTSKTGALNAVAVDGSGGYSAGAEVPVAAASEADGAACYLRPGDAGFEECEACQ
ncbi:ribonucleoside-diphosphate reductase subunit alpha [Undibacterium sp. RTI2.1]|uniref:ribonucleoside-diphosphate reductase subunit alpha n=1 Tax=unclassified Undibacterium TaxID=2630295 RepID=UPI002AB5A433|nr:MULTISPECIES: ribonucleoside-diphosphate reductase subunit alpha [unclassified Undibacterium]MDY7540585.1 ribonucleoside-diphosphate reductase subunit alpha [Undibacterium sp. 5I1]MEB0029751.1 ribonucleoside-diphosphate reductase subunit alpha [Undibacterium sp. RTI2.1]MEB0118141.1 ribonucleoside-diphosphate reductase subunit alpha [Undibacterium sp. RTI2.2]MEB0231248.1 ribonucleoside-diphosphate reductase subunit alpha [Undibacterium sp. 10I3]MEB0256551.1 ribonucleoside-diphosphate reducta